LGCLPHFATVVVWVIITPRRLPRNGILVYLVISWAWMDVGEQVERIWMGG
jgi:hypothetical protein